MRLIGYKNDFFIYFIASDQKYIVFKGGKKLISGYSYSEVKCYLD
jgi:hypothetical protein